MKRPVPTWLKKAAFKRNGGQCQKCGISASLTVHHIHAVADGGLDTLENACTLCSTCHVEWHQTAEPQKVAFEDWLELPSPIVASTLMRLPIPANVSAAEFRDAMKTAQNIYRSMNEIRHGMRD